MDVLSEALSAVRVTGAIFFHAECRAPWGFAVPAMGEVAHVLAPGVDRIVGYHLVTDGEALVHFPGAAPVLVEAGDIVISPHGVAHTVCNGSPPSLIGNDGKFNDYLSGRLPTMRVGGRGAVTRFVCGYFGCERHADRLFLSGLPSMIKISIRGDAAGAWLESSVRLLVDEAQSDRPGRAVLLARTGEALFIEALRRHMEALQPEQRGWLAGARDPVVGKALGLLHRTPAKPWTLATLAAEAGASRSALALRFSDFLGEPPMTYLTRWRLLLASRLIETTRRPIIEVASEVGYESEAAFNRAFKREFGDPPARYRRKQAELAEPQDSTEASSAPRRTLPSRRRAADAG